MTLIELGEQWLVFARELREKAQWKQLTPEIKTTSINFSNPPLEAAILQVIADCTDVEELKAFVGLDENFDMPLQSRFDALERWLELGGHTVEALELYQWTHSLFPLHYLYEELQQHLYATLTQLKAENAPPEAYERLRAETVERINALRQERIYALDPPQSK
jgi:hypothetical protein